MEQKDDLHHQSHKEMHDDPSNWKWGIFYYNPKDKIIFPPKRIGSMGWTINFASPVSILPFVALLAVVLTVIYLMF